MNWFTKLRWRKQIAASDLCAIPRLLEIPDGKRVLIFAPHADDEVLGCGGTMALLAQRGCQVHVAVVTDGAKGDPENRFGGRVAALRQQEVIAALDVLGIQGVEFLGEPDGELEVTSGLTFKMASVYDRFRPDWVFLPSISDYHRDHIGVSLAGLDLWAKTGGPERLFLYEIWGGFPANRLVDITSVIEQKKLAIQEYKVPLSYLDYAGANIGLAAHRGMFLSEAQQARYAEAFIELPVAGKGTAIIDWLMQARTYVAGSVA